MKFQLSKERVLVLESFKEGKEEKTIKKRYIHLEAMRIVAIFFVIFNHTGNNGFFLFSGYPAGSLQFWVYLFMSVFCKFAVPLFFAISGALMLNKTDESLKKIWKQKILRIVIILFVYSVGYYIYEGYIITGGITFAWKDFLIKLYSGNIMYHLWYLYLYIAFLAALPFLRAMVRNLEDKYFYYMFFIAVFFAGIVPSFEYWTGQGMITLNSNLKLSWLINAAVLYPCLGYFMQNRLDVDKCRKGILPVWIFNILGIITSCYMTYYKGTITGVLQEAESQTFHSCFAMLNCVAVFITVRYLFEKIEVSFIVNKIILSLGSCTFGIYLCHAWVLKQKFYENGLYMLQSMGWNYMVVILVMCFLVMMISYILVMLLSKIPIVKKAVGF